ncbi:MAG: hypothetical protein GC202_08940 [Alphaproteobacteria bacterium]|nr:hypothetical protein [Alphaproteobacteria bacterium]
MPDPLDLFASVIILLPMGYFFLQSPAFLLVQLENPTVTRLFRGMFSIYFMVLATAGAIGAIAFAVEGRITFTLGMSLILTFAILARRWFLRRIDAELTAKEAGDRDALRRLRKLHWKGMLCNAAQLLALLTSIPYLAVAP